MLSRLVKLFGYTIVATLTIYIAFFEFETVLKEIDEEFTDEERERLLYFLFKKLRKSKEQEARKRARLQQVEALWAMLPENAPNYTDAEFDEMKVQWRMEKYS